MISPTLVTLRSLLDAASCDALLERVTHRQHLPPVVTEALRREGMADYGHAAERE